MIPGTANPSAKLRGDYWEGWSSITISPGPGVALASAKIEFSDPEGRKHLTLSTADDSITITQGGTGDWILAVPGRTLDIPATDYSFELQTTDANGNVRTYWRGTVQIQQDITE